MDAESTGPAGTPEQTPREATVPPAPNPRANASSAPASAPAPDTDAAGVQPPAPPTPKNAPQRGAGFAQLLKKIKLPERRGQNSAAAKPAKRYDTTLAGQALDGTPPAPASAPTAPQQQQQQQKEDIVEAVHTLKNDLRTVVHDEDMSVVRAASLEEERRARAGAPHAASTRRPRRSHRALGILFAAVFLVVLGIGALWGVYAVMSAHSGMSASSALPQSSILFAESSVAFPLDGASPEALKQQLSQARNTHTGSLGSITRIVPTVKNPDGTVREATLSEFLKAIGANPPADLLRALSDRFFFGFHTVDVNAPLFVIPVTSYDHAFADMLAWEPTMDADLAPIFPSVPATKIVNGIPEQRTFQDLLMQNHDTRVLEDNAGNVKLYYSFPTRNILVIAESPYSFTEILSRLQAAHEL